MKIVETYLIVYEGDCQQLIKCEGDKWFIQVVEAYQSVRIVPLEADEALKLLKKC